MITEEELTDLGYHTQDFPEEHGWQWAYGDEFDQVINEVETEEEYYSDLNAEVLARAPHIAQHYG
jgi:hypothetical protein